MEQQNYDSERERYLYYAEMAAQHEKAFLWQEAAKMWRMAAACASAANDEWCVNRAEFCEKAQKNNYGINNGG